MKNLYLLTICFFTCFNVNSASFDCSKSLTDIEKTICREESLGNLDEELSHLYSTLRSSLNTKESQTLLNKQREWIKSRNSNCAEPTDQESCLTKLYQKRMSTLKKQKKDNRTFEKVAFIPLPKSKRNSILELPESYGFPKGKSVLKKALYYKASDHIDLIDVNYAPPVISGLYKIDYNKKTSKRIAKNLANEGSYSSQVGNKTIFITKDYSIRRGHAWEGMALLVIGPNNIYEKSIYSGEYIYSENEYPLCSSKTTPKISIASDTAKKIESYKLSSDNEFNLRITINSTDCATGESRRVIKTIGKSHFEN